MEEIEGEVINELVKSSGSKKKHKKRKKNKKSKMRRRRSRRGESSSADESVDSFDENFHDAVLDTNLDTVADRQLKQLAELQEELLELQKASEDDGDSDDDPFLPPSNQEAEVNFL